MFIFTKSREKNLPAYIKKTYLLKKVKLWHMEKIISRIVQNIAKAFQSI